jgi:hypothetical protein
MYNPLFVIDSMVDESFNLLNMKHISVNESLASARAMQITLSRHGTVTCYFIQFIAPEAHIELFPVDDRANAKDITQILEYICRERCGGVIHLGGGFIKRTENIELLQRICERLLTKHFILVAPQPSKLECISYPSSFRCVIGVCYQKVTYASPYCYWENADYMFTSHVKEFSDSRPLYTSYIKPDSCSRAAMISALIHNAIRNGTVANFEDAKQYLLNLIIKGELL